MTLDVYLVGDCDLRLWGLTPRQRLERQLRSLPQTRLLDHGQPLPPAGEVLLLRADYVYDERVLRGLLKAADVALQDPRDGTVVAARSDAYRWHGMPQLSGPALAELAAVLPAAVAEGLQAKLRKFDKPWVAPVSATNRRHLEKALFSGAYKGVTDFITRAVWPMPARWATKLCISLGLSPNAITAGSYVFAILAGWWFWQGAYGWGLLAGWLMTFLDTVDGKLARVTLTSSNLGNILDHALDLVHPPLWYLAWGMGLGLSWQLGPPLADVLWVIFAGYVGGRLCEGAFKFAAPFSLFIWRPFDSVNRLVTARRNPNLLILSIAWLAGSNDTGLLLVAAWTLISTLVLLARVLWGLALRWRGHELQPWLSRIDPQADSHRPLVRLFAPGTGPADV
ncbi:MAG: CDP-alcohol phosphatidyltransferase family protein [Porticoccaceae bacterium]